MIKSKHIPGMIFFLISGITSAAVLREPGSAGSKWFSLESGATALRNAGGGPGKVFNGVNLYTGQPSYSIPLGSIAARTVGFPITLNYGGPTKPTVLGDNKSFPTSWVGLGFNLDMPFVATNHKGTYSPNDDVVYCNLGPYGGGQILADSTNKRFYLSTNPYIKVSFTTATSGEFSGQPTQWNFVFPDGKTMVFGQDANAQRYVFYNGSTIGAFPYSGVTPQKFIYQWDLRTFYDTIPNRAPRNILTFEYQQFTNQVAPGFAYVNEGYIKNIKWMEGSQEVERYEFKVASKDPSEYVGYTSTEPKDDQRLYETQHLDSLKFYQEGSLVRALKFDYITQSKSLLADIHVFHPLPISGTLQQDSGWTFTYNDVNKYYLLNSVVSPNSRIDTLKYTSYDFTNTQGAQDAGVYNMMRIDTVLGVYFPSDPTQSSKDVVESTCDERFCYNLFRDKAYNHVYIEVKRNNGNYFDSRSLDGVDVVTLRDEEWDNSNTSNDWQMIPTGNYLILYSENAGTFYMWEFDGVGWKSKNPFQADPMHFSTHSFNKPIKIVAGSNYFVVQTYSSVSDLYIAVRVDTGWTSLNAGNNCQITNNGSYGETIRNTYTSGSECLEWNSSNLIITTNTSFFTVVENAVTGVICAYAWNSQGNGFVDVTNQIPKVSPSTLQKSGYNMNWEDFLFGTNAYGDEIFFSTNHGYCTGLQYDGKQFREIFSYAFALSPRIYLSNNYAIAAMTIGTIQYIPKIIRADGTPYFDISSAVTARTDWNGTDSLLIRTHPNAFTVEYYSNAQNIGLRPKHTPESPTNYASYIYQVDRRMSPNVMDRTSQFLGGGLRLFNISFSSSDNALVGTSGVTSTGMTCTENLSDPCIIQWYSALFAPDNFTTFGYGVQHITTNTTFAPRTQAQDVMSNCARNMSRIVMDAGSSSCPIRIQYFQFGYRGYSIPDNTFVVSDVISSANLDGADKNRVWNKIYYPPNGSGTVAVGNAEFNSQLQTPQFEFADVRQVKSDGSGLGIVRTYFNLDYLTNPLSGKSSLLWGTEKYSQTISNIGDTMSVSRAVDIPYRSPYWPRPLYVNRIRSSYADQVASNNSRIRDTTYYFNYCDTNGVPRFVLQNNRPEKIILHQNIYDSLGFTAQSTTFNLPSQPDTSMLRVWDPLRPYNNYGVVLTSKSVFNGYYFQRDSSWNQTDPTLTQSDLASGKAPSFTQATGWMLHGQVTERDTNNFFQVVEEKVRKSNAANARSERFSSLFYEGLRSDPVAIVSNAKLSDCAVLMAENGNAVLGSGVLDYRGRWSNPGTVFSSVRTHTGRYSFKVTDNYGPTANLYLKDVRDLGYSFRISAWIYSDSPTPTLAVERRQSNGTLLDVTYGSPVNGTPSATKVWQRWEVRLTYSQLTAGGLFSGNADYLRIWAGTGAPANNSSRVVYVDDIVCIPSTATFTLTTFDKSGAITSSTGDDFITLFHDVGFKGNTIATRDSRFRIYGEAAANKMGEN